MTFQSTAAAVVTAIASVALISAPTLAQAQDTGAARAEAFAAVLADPSNPEIMIVYARASVADGDFEAAAATLERLLDLEPANSTARLELGILYFSLGSYEIAQFHFQVLQARGAGGDTVDQYLDLIAEAQNPQSFGGSVTFGAASMGDGDHALSYGFNLAWTVDMGGPSQTEWITGFQGLGFSGSDSFDATRVVIRTGPEFAIDGEAYGARLRPYAELAAVFDPADSDSRTYSLGVAYNNPNTDALSTFADLSVGRQSASGTATDADVWSASAGLSVKANDALSFRFSLDAASSRPENILDGTDTRAVGASVSTSGTGFLGLTDQDWSAQAFVRVAEVDYVEVGREDRVTSYGISVRAYVSDSTFLSLSARQVDRDSSDNSFDTRSPMFSVQYGLEF